MNSFFSGCFVSRAERWGRWIAVSGRLLGKVQGESMGKTRLGNWGAERTVEVTMPPPRQFILFTPLALMRVAE